MGQRIFYKIYFYLLLYIHTHIYLFIDSKSEKQNFPDNLISTGTYVKIRVIPTYTNRIDLGVPLPD